MHLVSVLVLFGLLPIVSSRLKNSSLVITDASQFNKKINCELLVRPPNGFMSIVDDRITLSVVVTCTTAKELGDESIASQLRTKRYHTRRSRSFLIISEELSVHAFPEDNAIVHVQPKYGTETLLVPQLTVNRSIVTTETPTALVSQTRIPGVHVIKFRPGISQTLQWCAFPKLLGRTSIIFTIKRLQVRENVTIFGEIVAERSYLVKVCRNFRVKDMVFRVAMALASSISAAGLGCGVDIRSVIAIFKQQHPIIRGSQGLIALLIQIAIRVLLLPGMSVGFGMLVGLSHTTIGGLLFWSTICGGGISYILSSAVDANEEFAIFLELGSVIIGIIFAPLWTFIGSVAMLDIFDDDADAISGMMWLYLWIFALNVPVAVGIVVREYFPLIAHIFIAWILRPSMLLFFILFITLGVYSNLTVVSEISTADVIALGIVISTALLVSLIVARFLSWPESIAKAVLSQQCSSNILLSLALCRLALRTPERDAFTKITFLAVFYSPMPFLLIKVCVVFKNQVSALYSRQHQQQVSLASGLADVVKNSLLRQAHEDIHSKQAFANTAQLFMQGNVGGRPLLSEPNNKAEPKDIISAL